MIPPAAAVCRGKWTDQRVSGSGAFDTHATNRNSCLSFSTNRRERSTQPRSYDFPSFSFLSVAYGIIKLSGQFSFLEYLHAIRARISRPISTSLYERRSIPRHFFLPGFALVKERSAIFRAIHDILTDRPHLTQSTICGSSFWSARPARNFLSPYKLHITRILANVWSFVGAYEVERNFLGGILSLLLHHRESHLYMHYVGYKVTACERKAKIFHLSGKNVRTFFDKKKKRRQFQERFDILRVNGEI